MKRKTWFTAAFLLISVMMFSLCACNKAPQTGEPGTEQPNTSADPSGDIISTGEPNTSIDTDMVNGVTQEDVAEMFMPSLEAYVSYSGSAFYTVEKDENGDIKEYPVKAFEDYAMNGYKVVEYNEFKPIAEQMRKYLSESVFEKIMVNVIYAEDGGDLYVMAPQVGGAYIYDITSIELLEADGDKYKIAVDCGEYPSGGNAIVGIYKSIFSTTLKDGVLVIESVDRGEAYTSDELKESASAEDRKWLNEMCKIYGTEAQYVPYDEDVIYNQ